MADGKGCKCMAYSESECACDVDWTPQGVYDLRAENEKLKEAIRRLADQDATLSVVGGDVIVEMDATLTAEEREAVAWAERFAHSQRDSRDNAVDYAATLRGLLERTK